MRATTLLVLLGSALLGLTDVGAQDKESLSFTREIAYLGTPTVNPPISHENISIYVLEDPSARVAADILTLEEGLALGVIRVSEKNNAQVNELQIDNRSSRPCFLQAGEIVQGGQQDRAVATDMVIPPHARRVTLPSFCVENGRWTGDSVFGATTGFVVGAKLRMAIQKEKDQNKVWQAVSDMKAQLIQTNALPASSSTSLNEQLLNQTLRTRICTILRALSKACDKKPHAIGIAMAINGKITTVDHYADPALFRKLYLRLLASTALEALSSPRSPSEPPAVLDTTRLLAKADAGRPSETKPTATLMSVLRETDHTLQFRCISDRVELHRQSLVKP